MSDAFCRTKNLIESDIFNINELLQLSFLIDKKIGINEYEEDEIKEPVWFHEQEVAYQEYQAYWKEKNREPDRDWQKAFKEPTWVRDYEC